MHARGGREARGSAAHAMWFHGAGRRIAMCALHGRPVPPRKAHAQARAMREQTPRGRDHDRRPPSRTCWRMFCAAGATRTRIGGVGLIGWVAGGF
jgi:hypothetical protein